MRPGWQKIIVVTKKSAPAGASKRLATYQRKRDFDVTSEPSGKEPPPSVGNRFVVQRHRASRLHYDFRLEADGVLVSWAVPKGPTLDPDVKRMAVHVEDHPLDYFDFEGVIPGGQYGGGDVIVWDWGTWEPAKGDDPLAAIESGDLHIDLHGEKLAGRFVLVRRGKPDDKEQWLLLHKHDEHAVAGWDPEDHPRSVKSGRTNDEVKAAPPATWSSSASWAGATADELEALDALGKAGEWQLGEHTLKLTNLDKVLFPGRRGKGPALTKRDLIRHHATMAPAMLPYLAGRPVNLHRFPDGVTETGFWQKAIPKHAPDWLTRWHYDDHGKGETEWYLVLDSAAALAWAANNGAVELHPWTSRGESPHEPTWAMIDIDPGTKATFEDALVLARLYRTALDHLDVQARPKVTGKRGIQIWVPVADRVQLRGDPGLGGDPLAGRRRHRARAGQLGVDEGQATRPHPPRLHAERDQQDARRSLQRPSGPRRRRCPCPSPGTSSTIPSYAPTAGRSGPSASAWRPQAIRWPRSSASSSACPACDRIPPGRVLGMVVQGLAWRRVPADVPPHAAGSGSTRSGSTRWRSTTPSTGCPRRARWTGGPLRRRRASAMRSRSASSDRIG